MAHHHHKRGHDCEHGTWATDDVQGHHHHKRGYDCVHGLWATDTVNGHHHHKRGGVCEEHHQWATSEEFSDNADEVADLGTSDRRFYAEVEAELAAQEVPGS